MDARILFSALSFALATTALAGCRGEVPERPVASPAVFAQAADTAAALPPEPVTRRSRTPSQGELVAIAQARERANAEPDTPGPAGTLAKGPTKLTSEDRRVANDDPAARAAAQDPAASLPRTLQIAALTMATGVEDREPVNVQAHYPQAPDTLYCHGVYGNLLSNATVRHEWRHNGRTVSRMDVEVGVSRSWRTWSKHRLPSDSRGEWVCEVLTPDGTRLGLTEVTVGP
jgi:hypothetical protein